MSEAQEVSKEVKKATEYTAVKMEDGSTVEFAGNRQTNKTVTVDEAEGKVEVRFDFRSGVTRTVSSLGLKKGILLRLIGHGLSQKIGDSWASIKSGLEDCVLAADEVIGSLATGEWGVAREAGDSMAGASLVIRAICEATGKDVVAVKNFLDGKLVAAKEAGTKLSRQELYQSFRNPTSKTGKIIARMEQEKAEKSSKVSADDLLAEIS